MIQPVPTKRFVLDPIRLCNIKCKMCYHLHSYEHWKDFTWTLEQVKARIDKNAEWGNNYMDVTGGEPTIFKHIISTIEYALSKNIRTCIITNGVVSEDRAREVMDAGLDDWLVSRHGVEGTHNYITNNATAYMGQVKFLDFIRRRMGLRFNCVINKFNQEQIVYIAKELAVWQPRIVNFINMNPHNEWSGLPIKTGEVIAELRIVEPRLNEAIAYLESKGIGVNVRYYPMCRLKEEYRRCVCNDLHVVFDPYEWTYDIMPKTLGAYFNWGTGTSNNVEEKGEPCNKCEIRGVCGGINKAFHGASNEIYKAVWEPVKEPLPNVDFYHYRRHNTLTLQER